MSDIPGSGAGDHFYHNWQETLKQRDDLLEACEGVIAGVESRIDEHGENCPMCGERDHADYCPYVAIVRALQDRR